MSDPSALRQPLLTFEDLSFLADVRSPSPRNEIPFCKSLFNCKKRSTPFGDIACFLCDIKLCRFQFIVTQDYCDKIAVIREMHEIVRPRIPLALVPGVELLLHTFSCAGCIAGSAFT